MTPLDSALCAILSVQFLSPGWMTEGGGVTKKYKQGLFLVTSTSPTRSLSSLFIAEDTSPTFLFKLNVFVQTVQCP